VASSPEDLANPQSRRAADGSVTPLFGAPGELAAPIDDDFAQLTGAVAGVLRKVHESMAAMRRQAESYAGDVRRTADEYATRVRAEAEQHARRLRHAAEEERATAKSTLVKAQEDAIVVVAEAHKRARTIVSQAEVEAQHRMANALARARGEVARLEEQERVTREALEALRSRLESALGSERDLEVDRRDTTIWLDEPPIPGDHLVAAQDVIVLPDD
jgi:F0F1-type ATP synthase membrane subunit b/b'